MTSAELEARHNLRMQQEAAKDKADPIQTTPVSSSSSTSRGIFNNPNMIPIQVIRKLNESDRSRVLTSSTTSSSNENSVNTSPSHEPLTPGRAIMGSSRPTGIRPENLMHMGPPHDLMGPPHGFRPHQQQMPHDFMNRNAHQMRDAMSYHHQQNEMRRQTSPSGDPRMMNMSGIPFGPRGSSASSSNVFQNNPNVHQPAPVYPPGGFGAGGQHRIPMNQMMNANSGAPMNTRLPQGGLNPQQMNQLRQLQALNQLHQHMDPSQVERLRNMNPNQIHQLLQLAAASAAGGSAAPASAGQS